MHHRMRNFTDKYAVLSQNSVSGLSAFMRKCLHDHYVAAFQDGTIDGRMGTPNRSCMTMRDIKYPFCLSQKQVA